jgi:hypothetical protein
VKRKHPTISLLNLKLNSAEPTQSMDTVTMASNADLLMENRNLWCFLKNKSAKKDDVMVI